MKKIVSLLLLLFFLVGNSITYALSDKYLNYSVHSESFDNPRINKKFTKEIFSVTNISNIPLKLEWSQQENDVTAQNVYDVTQHITTAGSQCVAFLGGLTIIGTPFAINGAVKMVQNKNEKLLNEINSYVKSGSINWNYILQPNETINAHLIKQNTSTQPIVLKMRFIGNNGKIIDEIKMSSI